MARLVDEPRSAIPITCFNTCSPTADCMCGCSVVHNASFNHPRGTTWDSATDQRVRSAGVVSRMRGADRLISLR